MSPTLSPFKFLKMNINQKNLDNIQALEKENMAIDQQSDGGGWLRSISGTKEVTAGSIKLGDTKSEEVIKTAFVNQDLTLKIRADFNRDVEKLFLCIIVRDRQTNLVWGLNTWCKNQIIYKRKAGESVSYNLNFKLSFGPSSYSITYCFTDKNPHTGKNFEC